jgi:hypothetical protein
MPTHQTTNTILPVLSRAKKHGANAQSPLTINGSQNLTGKEIKQVQEIVRSILYYAREI